MLARRNHPNAIRVRDAGYKDPEHAVRIQCSNGKARRTTTILETVTLLRPDLREDEMRIFNQEVRESAQITQNVGKGFVHYLKYFKRDQELEALMQVAKGLQGEYGWGVLYQQGRHRCVLTGTIPGRPEEEALEDAMWTACAEWANFEPVVWQPKTHVESFLFTEDCTHFFEGNEQTLHDLSVTRL
jgi:hypothetical protein